MNNTKVSQYPLLLVWLLPAIKIKTDLSEDNDFRFNNANIYKKDPLSEAMQNYENLVS